MSGHEAWVEVRVQVARAQTGLLESLLTSQGALSITLTDVADHPVLEPAVGETPLWPEVQLCGLFNADIDRHRLAAVLSLAPGVGSTAQITFAELEDRDWVRAWMDDFHPMKFGEKLWIVPGKQTAPDPDAFIVELDPGMAFGSGTHPTTRLCLEWIDANPFKGKNVVDFGCGSGVLGIAAAIKGASKVLCVDNDPQALEATRTNARRNGVEEIISVLAANEFSGASADVILANILAGTLVELAPLLCTSLSPDGQLALSGILPEQAVEVSDAYDHWLGGIETRVLDGWALISGTLRSETLDRNEGSRER